MTACLCLRLEGAAARTFDPMLSRRNLTVPDKPDERTRDRLARETVDQGVEQSDDVLWRVARHFDDVLRRVARHLPFLDGMVAQRERTMVAQRERTLALQQCIDMLDICGALKAENPKLEGEALYEHAIARRLSWDQARAREIVRLADLSFAQWPVERDVNLRDVVNYLIVHRILGAHTKAIGTQSDIERIVCASIPEGL